MEESDYLMTFYEDADGFNYFYMRITSTSKSGKWKKGHFVAHLKSDDEKENDIYVISKRPDYLSKKYTMSFIKSPGASEFPDMIFYKREEHVYQLISGSDIEETHKRILQDIE